LRDDGAAVVVKLFVAEGDLEEVHRDSAARNDHKPREELELQSVEILIVKLKRTIGVSQNSQSLRRTQHLPLPLDQIPIQLLVDPLPVLVLHRTQYRLPCNRLEDVGGHVETEDGGKRAEDGEDPDAEVVKGGEVFDGAFGELFLREGKKLDVGGDFGGIDDSMGGEGEATRKRMKGDG
jgi:hypothetical protein